MNIEEMDEVIQNDEKEKSSRALLIRTPEQLLEDWHRRKQANSPQEEKITEETNAITPDVVYGPLPSIVQCFFCRKIIPMNERCKCREEKNDQNSRNEEV